MQTVRGGLDRDAFVLVRKQPVELRGGKGGGKRRAGEIRLPEQHARRGNGGALREHPRDEFKLRNVALAAARRGVSGVADKVQPGDAQALLVDGVVIQRVILGHIGHTDHGVMGAQLPRPAENKRVVARGDRHLVPVRKFIIQIAAKVQIFGPVGCSSTH